jgi:rod shape-determining protein MreD
MRWNEKTFNRWATYGFLLLGTFIFQTTLADLLAIFRIKPALPLCFVICLALFEGDTAGAVAGFFTGLLCDSLGGAPFGFSILVYMIFGTVLGYLAKVYLRTTLPNAVIWTFSASAVYNLLLYLVYFVLRGRGYIPALYSVILPEALYTAAFAPLFYVIVFKVNAWIGAKE